MNIPKCVKHIISHRDPTDPRCVLCRQRVFPRPCGHESWCACYKYRSFPKAD